MISFVIGVSLFALGFLAGPFPWPRNGSRKCCPISNLFEQMHDFARGVVDTRAVIFLRQPDVFLFGS